MHGVFHARPELIAGLGALPQGGTAVGKDWDLQFALARDFLNCASSKRISLRRASSMDVIGSSCPAPHHAHELKVIGLPRG